MKRSRLNRGKPLDRGKPLARGAPLKRTRLRPVGRKRKVKTEKGFGKPHPVTGKTRGDAVRAMPCIVAQAFADRHGWTLDEANIAKCMGDIQACHARARGAGGVKGDAMDLFPGCFTHHAEAGELPGIGYWEGTARAVFEEKYGVSVTGTAAEIAADLTTRGYPIV